MTDARQVEMEQSVAFERLVIDIAAAFVDLPVDAIDEQITSLIGRVVGFFDLDRSQVAQRSLVTGDFHVTHQWVRESVPRAAPLVPAEAVPWLVQQVNENNPVIVSRLDELPPEASRERDVIGSAGTKSTAILPLTAGGLVLGAVTFGAVRSHRIWPPDVVDRLHLVARIVASALARKRADLELRATLADNERLRQRLEAENVYLQAEVRSVGDFTEIVGRSAALRAVLDKVDQVAATDVPVLLLGETGTGKELLAHAIHARSSRRDRPVIAVNCAALPPTLIESELFGHEKGAFTGATQARQGRFELADGSTLFLDEIGDLEPALQAKLLRALQEGEITRLGASVARKVNVRIIAATNRDLGKAIDDGRFRDDLYYRLSVFPIEVPPLRERREDIPLLVWRFIQSRQRALGRAIKSIPESVVNALVAYDWPGNIRELQNVIDRALILSSGSTLSFDESFGRSLARRGSNQKVQTEAVKQSRSSETLADAERAHIETVLRRCAWTIEGPGHAADRLGLRPGTLRHRMRKLGIRRPKPG